MFLRDRAIKPRAELDRTARSLAQFPARLYLAVMKSVFALTLLSVWIASVKGQAEEWQQCKCLPTEFAVISC